MEHGTDLDGPDRAAGGRVGEVDHAWSGQGRLVPDDAARYCGRGRGRLSWSPCGLVSTRRGSWPDRVGDWRNPRALDLPQVTGARLMNADCRMQNAECRMGGPFQGSSSWPPGSAI